MLAFHISHEIYIIYMKFMLCFAFEETRLIKVIIQSQLLVTYFTELWLVIPMLMFLRVDIFF